MTWCRRFVAAAKMYPPSEASCEAGSMRGARRSSQAFSIQSARRRQNGGNAAKARRGLVNRARRRWCEKDILLTPKSPVGNWRKCIQPILLYSLEMTKWHFKWMSVFYLYQEISVSPHPVERADSPLLQHTGGPLLRGRW